MNRMSNVGEGMRSEARGLFLGVAFVVVVMAGILQLVPYGRNHTDPPVQAEPAWNSAETRALAVKACFDCHSNQTSWPWYSNVAPASWLVQYDVDKGRRVLNFSTWGRGEQKADEAAKQVVRGKMPPMNYMVLHPGAVLSPGEKQALADGLAATFGQEGGSSEGEGSKSKRDD